MPDCRHLGQGAWLGALAAGFRPGGATPRAVGAGKTVFTLMMAQISRCFALEGHNQFGVHAAAWTGGARSCAINRKMPANR